MSLSLFFDGVRCQNEPTSVSTETPSSIYDLPLQVTKVVGGGQERGDGYMGQETYLSEVRGSALDPRRNLYLFNYDTDGDVGNHIKKLTRTTGLLHSIAGRGELVGADMDNNQATSALLGPTRQLYYDNNQLYLSDTDDRVIRKIEFNTGTLSLYVGNYERPYSLGNYGPATSAKVYGPYGMWLDSVGNFYYADAAYHHIRKRETNTTIISTVVGDIATTGGNMELSLASDNGPCTSARLNRPSGLWGDTTGNVIYFCDSENSAIRRADFLMDVITTIVGAIGPAGMSGDGGPATSATLNWPRTVWQDLAGNMVFGDTNNFVIRGVAAPNSLVVHIVGRFNHSTYYGDDGPAVGAAISYVTQLVGDSDGNIVFADSTNRLVRLVYNSSVANSTFSVPTQMPTDSPTGTPIFSPTGKPSTIYDLPLQITTVVGGGQERGDGYLGPETYLSEVCGSVLDPRRNLYLFNYDTDGDVGNHIKKLTRTTGLLHSIAGRGELVGADADNIQATSALLGPTNQLYYDKNQLYLTDTESRVIKTIDLDTGIISLYVGVYERTSATGNNGPATSAKVYNPYGMWLNSAGDFYFTDAVYQHIRKRAAITTVITMIAGDRGGDGGNMELSLATDNGPCTSARLNRPSGLWGDTTGNVIYFCDSENNAIRRADFLVDVVTTVVGAIGPAGMSGDGGPATSATLSLPNTLWLDTAGNMVFGDTDNSVIRGVTAPNSLVSRITGQYDGSTDYVDDGPAVDAAITFVTQLVGDSDGNIVFADSFHRLVRTVYNASIADRPFIVPTEMPMFEPTAYPTFDGTFAPTMPTLLSMTPTQSPTESPSMLPTCIPTNSHTESRTVVPSMVPVATSAAPTAVPTIVTNSLAFKYLNSIGSGRTELTVTAELTRPGAVSCGVFLPGGVMVDVSNVQVLIALQGFTVSSNAQNMSAVTIGGLLPATEYTVYCFAQGMNGEKTTAVDTLASKLVTSTQCCQTITLSLITTNAVENKRRHSFLSLSLSSRPEDELTVTLRTTVNGSEVPGGIFEPSRFTLASEFSQSLVINVGLRALPPGIYVTSVELSGPSAAYFDVIHSIGDDTVATTSVMVYSATNSPPVPQLLMVRFSDDGTYLKVDFDSDTDRGGTSTAFPYDQLFKFDCTETTRCLWVSDTAVHAYLSDSTSASCVVPGSNFTVLQSGHIKAKCSFDGYQCDDVMDSWPSVVERTLTIQTPRSAVIPSVVLVMPDTISKCDDLWIDVSASSGSGGRAFKSVTLSITSSTGHVTTGLQSYLSENTLAASSPLFIPAELLQKGITYTVTVSLCNFLDKCSQASRRLAVLNEIAPTVTLPGSSLRRMIRSDILSITSIATVQQCNGTQSSLGLTYQWTVSKDGTIDAALITTSKDPSKLLLPAFLLQTFGLYTVKLTVTSRETQQSSTATTQVYVTQGKVHARLAGGTAPRSVRMNESTVISASTSYDEDVAGMSVAQTGMQFTWSCIQLEPVYNETCGNVFSLQLSMTGDQSVIYPLSTAILNSAVQLTVTVTDSTGLRTSEAETIVTLRPALSPVAEIALVGSPSGVVNADQILRLSATVWFPQDTRGNATWSVDDGSLPLRTLALTSTYRLLMLSSASTAFTNLYFALQANTMTVGSHLTFSLTCVALDGSQLSTVASIVVMVNTPPLPGLFTASPPDGIELDTQFQFLAAHWVDEQLPLTYQFGYGVSGNSGMVVLRERNEFTSTKSVLPAGTKSAQYQLTCVVRVFDSLNASTTKSQTVTVRRLVIMDVWEIEQYVNEILSKSSGSVSSGLQAVAMSSYLLNAANCTLAPDCAALNRHECSSTEHTCGHCLLNEYIGTLGDSNDQCLPLSRWDTDDGEEAYDGSCVNTLSCRGFDTCRDGTCVTPNKTCPASCSGRGDCVFASVDTGAPLANCKVDDTSCVAVCLCESAFNMRSTCSVINADIQLKRQARAEVIKSIVTLVNTQDADVTTVSSWMNALAEATRQSDELSLEAVQMVLELSNSILNQASTVSGFTHNNTGGLISAVDHSTQAVVDTRMWQQYHSGSVYGDGDDVSVNVSFLAVQTITVLERYASLLSLEMVPGESPVELVKRQFRLGVHSLSAQLRLDGSSDGSLYVNATLDLPETESEVLTGEQPHSVELSFDRSSNSSKDSVQVVLISLRSVLYGANGLFQSNPLALHLSDLPCPNEVNCTVDIVLQTTKHVNWRSDDPPAVVSQSVEVECLEGIVTNTSHTFPALNYTTDTSCNGSYSGLVTYYSPEVTAESVCNSILGDTVVDIGCRVKTVTGSNITCVCPLVHHSSVPVLNATNTFNSTVNGTIPAAEDASNGGYSVSYVSMLRYTTRTFAANFRSITTLDAQTAAREYKVLITIAILVGFTLCALFFADRLDREARKLHAVESHLYDVSLWRAMQSSIQAYIALRQEITTVRRSNQILPVSATFERTVSRNSRSSSAKSSFMRKVEFQKLDSLRSPELTRVDNSLPNILRSTSLGSRIANELKTHHKWLCVVYFYSTTYPRVLRVFALASSVTAMLFFQSLTYNLIHPDTDACSQHTTEADCVAPQSVYATGESMCRWFTPNSGTSECKYIEPNQRFRIILFVVILSAALSVPVAVLIHWLIKNVLAAETIGARSDNYGQNDDDDDNVDNRQPRQKPGYWNNTNTRHSNRVVLNAHGFASDEEEAERMCVVRLHTGERPRCFQLPSSSSRDPEYIEASHLNDELRAYRLTLQNDAVRKEFDTLWGLDDLGFFCNREFNAEAAVKRDIKEVKLIANTEREHLERIGSKQQMKQKISKRLLFLLQCDLLPEIQRNVLVNKARRDDSTQVRQVSWTAKILTVALITAVLAGMVLYIILYALNQSSSNQEAWLSSFLLWLFIEVVLSSTNSVLLTHVLLPSLVMCDVDKLKIRLVDAIRTYQEELRMRQYSSFKKPDTSKSNVLSNSDFLIYQNDWFLHGWDPNEAESEAVLSESVLPKTASTVFSKQLNAAKYLNVSHRLSSYYPALLESQVVARFVTVYPRHSYQYCDGYSDHRHTVQTRSIRKSLQSCVHMITLTVMFVCMNILNLSVPLQDCLAELVSVVVVGYFVLLHIDLWVISPALIALPVFVIMVVVHFYTAAKKGNQMVRLLKQRAAAVATPEKQEDTLAGDTTTTGAKECKTDPRSIVPKATATSSTPGSTTRPVSVLPVPSGQWENTETQGGMADNIHDCNNPENSDSSSNNSRNNSAQNFGHNLTNRHPQKHNNYKLLVGIMHNDPSCVITIAASHDGTPDGIEKGGDKPLFTIAGQDIESRYSVNVFDDPTNNKDKASGEDEHNKSYHRTVNKW